MSIVKAHTRGTLYAILATLGCVLVFALIIQMAGLSGAVIKPVAQIIKVLSIFLGVFITIRRVPRMAWLHGAVLGLIYTVLAFFIFSILDNNFSITGGFFIDMLFAVVIGVISALLIRIRKKDF